MKMTERFEEWIADAFPRVKGSSGTKGNWVYHAHQDLRAAIPGTVPAPWKYQEGASRGTLLPEERSDVLQFLQKPFLSDVAYMLASDTITRVDRAKRCVDEAWGALGEHRMCVALERAWYSIPPALNILQAERPDLHYPITALLTAYAAAIVFTKMRMAALSGKGVPFAWGPGGVYYFLGDAEGRPIGGLDALSILCAFQRCSALSHLSVVGAVEPREEDFPGVLIAPGRAFFDAWGPGWLVWQLLDTAQRLGSRRSKRHADAVEKAGIIFPLSFQGARLLSAAFFGAMPKTGAGSYAIREEVLRERRYALWPGVTDVEWTEAGLEGMTLLPAKDGRVWAVLHGTVDLSGVHGDWGGAEAVPAQMFVEVPALRDDAEWEDARQDAEQYDPDLGGAVDPLALPMEAIRMCCVPTERKSRAGRVPSGYVHAPREGKAGAGVSVIYVPRVRARGDGEASSPRADGVREIGAVGAARRHHQVAGHIRQLAMEQSASDEARARASEAGLDLPLNGFTWVRPHSRGSGEPEDGAPRRTVRFRREDR
ncbi:MAG: hypothetical protein IJR14_05125 [Synergistaceae bacterium]|nr:hypothetical protein [Synergistaceae bacterium]